MDVDAANAFATKLVAPSIINCTNRHNHYSTINEFTNQKWAQCKFMTTMILLMLAVQAISKTYNALIKLVPFHLFTY